MTAAFGPAGEAPAGPVLGALAADAASGLALIRLHPGPSVPRSPDEAGYRLVVDWRPLGGASGMSRRDRSASSGRSTPLEAPLYRWRRPGSSGQLFTLGERPASGTWEFAGTLGLAWRPQATSSGLVGLWGALRRGPARLRRGPRGVHRRGVHLRTGGGQGRRRWPARSVPLWRTALGNDSPWRFTTCPSDGEADGYVRQGVIGHLLAAHPPPEPTDPRRADPLTAPLDTVAGPTPGALPVYLVSDGISRWATTSLHGDLARISVEEVLGYLPAVGIDTP